MSLNLEMFTIGLFAEKFTRLLIVRRTKVIIQYKVVVSFVHYLISTCLVFNFFLFQYLEANLFVKIFIFNFLTFLNHATFGDLCEVEFDFYIFFR